MSDESIENALHLNVNTYVIQPNLTVRRLGCVGRFIWSQVKSVPWLCKLLFDVDYSATVVELQSRVSLLQKRENYSPAALNTLRTACHVIKAWTEGNEAKKELHEKAESSETSLNQLEKAIKEAEGKSAGESTALPEGQLYSETNFSMYKGSTKFHSDTPSYHGDAGYVNPSRMGMELCILSGTGTKPSDEERSKTLLQRFRKEQRAISAPFVEKESIFNYLKRLKEIFCELRGDSPIGILFQKTYPIKYQDLNKFFTGETLKRYTEEYGEDEELVLITSLNEGDGVSLLIDDDTYNEAASAPTSQEYHHGDRIDSFQITYKVTRKNALLFSASDGIHSVLPGKVGEAVHQLKELVLPPRVKSVSTEEEREKTRIERERLEIFIPRASGEIPSPERASKLILDFLAKRTDRDVSKEDIDLLFICIPVWPIL